MNSAKTLLKKIVPQSTRARVRLAGGEARHKLYQATLWGLQFVPDGHIDLKNVLVEAQELTPETVILGYAGGLFPSPVHNGPMRWHDPDLRAVLPLDAVRIPKRMRSYLNQGKFDIRFNTDFAGVLEGCAEPVPGRETTFITPELHRVTMTLHEMGFAHSVEAFQDGALVGGLYGTALGGFFSLNSMFHRENNASKIALLYLVEVLRRNAFGLLDMWWMQPHFEPFGAVEIPREEFKNRLARALILPAAFRVPAGPLEVDYHEYD
ncbi:MAG: leucyl/phenylalanyl-tRNA--protein transferase [Anaerolineae bacterium]|nr:leucyl/phenylalanyl-tRNA--protein transferase [Anaerolineae bacterium]